MDFLVVESGHPARPARRVRPSARQVQERIGHHVAPSAPVTPLLNGFEQHPPWRNWQPHLQPGRFSGFQIGRASAWRLGMKFLFAGARTTHRKAALIGRRSHDADGQAKKRGRQGTPFLNG